MEEFDLKRFAKTAWQKKWLIIAIMVISMIIGYVYSYFFVVPKYQSATTIVLTKVETAGESDGQDSITQTDITMNKSLVDTYSNIITSNKVSKTVIENLGLDMSEEDLKEAISVTTGETTAMLKITVSNENAELARDLTNEVAKVFSEQIKEIYKIDNVNIIDEAELEMVPYNVHHVKDLAIFFVLGLFLSGGVILLIYMLDTTIKQVEDIENLKLQVIGVVPLYEKDCETKMLQEVKKDYKPTKSKRSKESELIVLENAKSPITEAFRTLRTNITFSRGEGDTRNILISSSNSQDGKSYVSSNLAIMFAKANKRVILVDADMRKGRQNKIFKVSNSQGLSNCLVDMTTRARLELSQMSKYIKATRIPNLHVITSGDRPSNPAELLSPARIVKLLELLDTMYDIVIIDGTPSAIVSDSIAISKFVDIVLLVASYKNTKTETLAKVKKSFENVGGKITGVILNKYPFSKSTYTESYYYDDTKNGDKKDIEQQEQIKTVSEIIEEATRNPKTRERRVTYEKEDNIWEERSLANIPRDEQNQYLEYKIENISNELVNIKNLFIQAMMENKKIDPRDIADIKSEINSMKQMLDLRNDLDVSKEIRDEIESVKAITENLADIQRENNEKVRKFIEDYRKRRG